MSSAAGSAGLQPLAMSARRSLILPTLTLHLERCCWHSLCWLQAQTSASACSSCAACTCPCSSRLAHATAVPASTSAAGVLAARAPQYWSMRWCQEAGAHLVRNVRLAAMNGDVPVQDQRMIEVVSRGLLLWDGVQLAVDATVVSRVTNSGDARPAADTEPGWAVASRQTYPSCRDDRRSTRHGKKGPSDFVCGISARENDKQSGPSRLPATSHPAWLNTKRGRTDSVNGQDCRP